MLAKTNRTDLLFQDAFFLVEHRKLTVPDFKLKQVCSYLANLGIYPQIQGNTMTLTQPLSYEEGRIIAHMYHSLGLYEYLVLDKKKKPIEIISII